MAKKIHTHVDELLEARKDKELYEILIRKPPAVVADVIDGLVRGKRKIFAHLPPEKQAEVIMLLSEGNRQSIIPRLTDGMISRLLHFLNEDDATDVLQHIPVHRQQPILHGVQPGRRQRIEKLLTFNPETAGGLMHLHFIEVAPEFTVHQLIGAIHDYVKQHNHVPVVFLRTEKGMRLIPARAIVSAQPHVNLEQLSRPVPTVLHSIDREQVLAVMSKENCDSICVVDQYQKILGVIHLHDLLRIAKVEASEDVYHMGAVATIDTNYLGSKFSTIWKKRVGWLSVLFLAELFTFTALAKFESSIEAVTALALFVPLCISTGGNSGSQAATIITRAMALGYVSLRDWFKVLKRELFMGLALGLALGLVGFFRASFTPQHILGDVNRYLVGLTIGFSVAGICLWGTLVGSMLPMLFKKMGFDPAYASSPFVATFVDVTGIVIYFSIAHSIIL